MDREGVRQNVYSVLGLVERAAERAGNSVKVVAATKTVAPELMQTCVDCGVTALGENRVQEYLAKKDAVSGAEWHFIGTLQRNKAKYLVGNVSLIQSVNSAALAAELDRLAKSRGVVQDVLIELELGGEASKTGAPVEACEELIGAASQLPFIRLRGLMAVPPAGCGDGPYKRLYKLFAAHRGGCFDTLSVGMSGDYERAIANGSNMVRLGTAIFGSRNYRE